jgi:hypothetical protein
LKFEKGSIIGFEDVIYRMEKKTMEALADEEMQFSDLNNVTLSKRRFTLRANTTTTVRNLNLKRFLQTIQTEFPYISN